MRLCILILWIFGLSTGLFAQSLPIAAPLAHSDSITALSFSTDNKYLFSGSVDGSIVVWHISTGAVLKRNTEFFSSVDSIRPFQDDRYAMIDFSEGSSQLWDWQANRFLSSDESDVFLQSHQFLSLEPESMFFQSRLKDLLDQIRSEANEHDFSNGDIYASSPERKYLAYGTKGGQIKLYHLSSKYLIRTFESLSTAHRSASFNALGTGLELIGLDGKIRNWDFESGNIKTVNSGIKLLPTDLKPIKIDANRWAFHQAGQGLFLFDQKLDSLISLYALSPGKEIVQMKYDPEKDALIVQEEQNGKKENVQINLKNKKVEGLKSNNPKVLDLFSTHSKINLAAGFKLLSQDDQYVITSNESGQIKIFNAQNRELFLDFQAHQGLILDAQVSPDQTRLMTSGLDGKLKLWDLKTGELQFTLWTVHDLDWVVFHPSDRFDASFAAEGQFFLLDTDSVQVSLKSLSLKYQVPSLILADSNMLKDSIPLIRTLSKDLNIKVSLSYNDGGYQEPEKLTNGEQRYEFKSKLNKLLFRLEGEKKSKSRGKLIIRLNGKQIVSDTNGLDEVFFREIDVLEYLKFCDPTQINTISSQIIHQNGWFKSEEETFYFEYPWMALKENEEIIKIRDVIRYLNEPGNEELSFRQVYIPSPQGWGGVGLQESKAEEFKRNQKLFVLTVGTSDYSGTDLDLNFADDDAQAMAESIFSVGGQLFNAKGGVDIQCLTAPKIPESDQLDGIQYSFASKDSILSALDIIRKKARSYDVIILHFSGHGITYGSDQDAQFYYLTQGLENSNLSDSLSRVEHAISSVELSDRLAKIPANKQVLIFDACNSGKLLEDFTLSGRNLDRSQIDAFRRMNDANGMFILSGSASDQKSYESSVYGQGLLTHSLLKGMIDGGTHARSGGKFVDVMRLFQYAIAEVPLLSSSVDGIQKPELIVLDKASSFDIGIVNDSVSIKIAKEKPVFVKGNILNIETMGDSLELGALLEEELLIETEKGKNADLIYISVGNYPGAYKVNGFYTMNEEGINMSASLIRSGFPSIKLEIEPQKEASKIVRIMMKQIRKNIQEENDSK